MIAPVLLLAALLATTIAIGAAIGVGGRSSDVARAAASESVHEAAESVGLLSGVAALGMREPDDRLLMPVDGVRVRQIADTWGAPRAGGRQHTGQDIFARRGTPVYSATDGYVLWVGESPVGGKTVFVLGAGGRRYYYAHLNAHAEGLAAGDYVTTERALGFVGTTGNAARTPPHLHFGVYTAAGAINPLPLLADRA